MVYIYILLRDKCNKFKEAGGVARGLRSAGDLSRIAIMEIAKSNQNFKIT